MKLKEKSFQTNTWVLVAFYSEKPNLYRDCVLEKNTVTDARGHRESPPCSDTNKRIISHGAAVLGATVAPSRGTMGQKPRRPAVRGDGALPARGKGRPPLPARGKGRSRTQNKRAAGRPATAQISAGAPPIRIPDAPFQGAKSGFCGAETCACPVRKRGGDCEECSVFGSFIGTAMYGKPLQIGIDGKVDFNHVDGTSADLFSRASKGEGLWEDAKVMCAQIVAGCGFCDVLGE